MKRLLILGSTGSIGQSTIDLVKTFREQFEIVGLTVNHNIDELEKQINEFNPKCVVVVDETAAGQLRTRIGSRCKVLSGNSGLLGITKNDNYDILVTALVGFAGLAPTIEAIKLKKRIALANKETLVVAGEIIIELCTQYGAELISVDSEHSAIFQCLIGEKKKNIRKLILTASGGPFLNKSKSELENVSVQEALAHPNWKMGNKITIDSATMMNKGLEVIEAYWLFHLPEQSIEVIIHPQSIIHSMVEFKDGSIKAQLSTPDMKLPILFALTYPDRYTYSGVPTNLKKIAGLTFFEPDFDKFVCLKIAYSVISEGGVAPCILNAANEVAVEKFIRGQIKFTQIPELIDFALNGIPNHKEMDLDKIFETDRKTREFLNKKFN